MSDFRPPERVKINLTLQSYSSGLREIALEGDSLGVVAALRAILSREGMGSPEEWRGSVLLSDVGKAHGSVYVIDSEILPVRGRHVSRKEAQRFGVDALRGIGAIIPDPDPGDNPVDNRVDNAGDNPVDDLE